MSFNGDAIEILAQPAAHSDGDLLVFFRRADVVVAGDVFVTDRFPTIDLARGGSINGLIDAADRIIDITIPRFNQQGDTLVVSGHGRLANEADVVEYRDMITIVRDRVARVIDDGMTLGAAVDAGLTRAYDPVMDSSGDRWSGPMFVEAVFRSLQTER